ncbi:DNA-binding protein [Capilliphycus salinus ALCB114379]|uniref:DNA-binding protein n=1 Tax=Capilliphycus salinus TaxID=2768948 RepID=UPI0039A40103
MVVCTTEAARILKISTARLRVLLSEGRVEGAYKSGKMWLIPLVKGEPIIERGKRGPAPRWCNLKKRAKKIVHVNSQRIRQNQKHQEQLPVITVKTGQTNTYGHIVEIPGGCRVVYRPNKPLPCGARVWIETFYDVNVVG